MLYDGECPLCKREVAHLQRRNDNACVKFVDIAAPDYRQHPIQNISYEKAMKEMLVVREGGEVLCGVEAFQEVYAKVRYPLLSILLQLPLLKYAFRFLYKVFARHRLTLTGRG